MSARVRSHPDVIAHSSKPHPRRSIVPTVNRPDCATAAAERGRLPLSATGVAHLIAVMVLAAAGLLVLWVGVATATGLAALDPTVSADVVAERPSWLATIGIALGDVGSPGVMIAVMVLVALLAAHRLRRVAPVIAAGAGLAALSVVDVGVKDLVVRPRPPLAGWAMSTSGFSFPSGHAVYSVGALLLGALLLRWSGRGVDDRDDAPRDGWKRALAVLAVVFVAAVGVSRVVVGVHYPSDVLAGWSLAVLVVGTVTLAVQTWTTRTTAAVEHDPAHDSRNAS